VFFYLSQLLFLGFLHFIGTFVHGKNNSKCRPWPSSFKTAGDGENNTTNLIKDTRLNLADALLQIKARLLHRTLGTLGDRTGRGVLLLRKRAFSVLYFQVHDDWQECHSQNCHDGGNDVYGSTDRTNLFLRLLVNCFHCRTLRERDN